MGFKGNVESFSLADVFQNLAMNSQTGTLRITPERNPHAEEKYVYFQDGHVRFLSGSSRAPLLPAEVFVARGLLSKSEFDAALLRQAESSETLVTCLSGLGYVNEQQVQELLVHQIEEEIYDLFGWEAASFEFNEGPPPEGLFAAEAAEAGWGISIQVSHLIMEAARRVDEWERLRKVIPSHKEIFVVDLTVRKAIERGEMETDPVERRVAMLIDGARDVDDIAEDSKLFKFEVIGALAGFLQSSIIRPATLNELNFSEGECARLDLPKRRVKILERILALGGENLRIRRELADLMAKGGQVEHACIHYSILASAEIKDGHEEGAIEIYKRILSIAPANVKTREALAALYAKRNQKRDAFIQYQDLFENLRDQHLLREARDAAVHALENDPTNSKMRNNLVELLLMEDKHDDAATQLELLGDYAARARNSSLAGDSYRRAMQYRKNIRPLKKKLNEVLLTKEDRVARTRRAQLSMLFLFIVLCCVGAIYYIESENQKNFDLADDGVKKAIAQADEKAKDGDLTGAITILQNAAHLLDPVKNIWSPFKGLKNSVDSHLSNLDRKKSQLKSEVEDRKLRAENMRVELRQDAQRDVQNFDYKAAKAKYEKLLAHPDETDDDKRADGAELAKVEKIIGDYKTARVKIEKAMKDPSVFKDAGEWVRTVDDFIHKYQFSKQEDFPRTIDVPLLVTPVNLDEVEVVMDDTPIGTIKSGTPWTERVVRYCAWPKSSHQFTFTKRGYTKQIEQSSAHQAADNVEVKVNLTREPAAQQQFTGIQFDGDAQYLDDMIYAGTSEGGLVEIDAKSNPVAITARFELKQPLAGVDKRVFGQIYIYSAPDKPPLFVYCTKAGYCAGLVKKDGKFEFAWPQQSLRVLDATQAGLDFPPTYFVQGGKPKIALIAGTRIVIVDAESGAALPLPLEMPLSTFNGKPIVPTAGACFIERHGEKDGDLLAVPGSDCNIHVFTMNTSAGKPKASVWTTDWSINGTVAKTPPIVVGDRLVVAGNSGSIRFFKLTGGRETADREAAGGIANPPLIDGSRAYFACAGTPAREGLSVVDMSTNDISVKSRNNIAVSLTPAVMNKRIYFVTEKPFILYATDERDINKDYWTYRVDRKVACPPITHGSMVYILTSDGGLIGFEESR